MSVLELIRPDLKSLPTYIPSGDKLPNRLHANELPWSPTSLEGVQLNHYPDSRGEQRLQVQLAEHYQVASDQIALTRGSDDGINLLMRLFLRAGQDSILQCPPTFPMYSFYAHLQQAEVLNCPLPADKGFSLAIDQLISHWQPNCKLIMICRPNNPTGNLPLDLAAIAKLCSYFTAKAVVVVDEAYIEFAQTASATTLLSSFDNLVVLRTLSKAYGLAGLRLGSIIAQSKLIEALRNTIPPYSLASAVIELAQQALVNKTWFADKINYILAERKQLIAQLQQSAWLERVYPSSTNFIFVTSAYAQQLALWATEHDIAIRHFAANPLANMLRITVGEQSQNQRLLAVLNSFQP